MSDTSPPFSQRQAVVLTSVASALYPHPGLDEEPYRRVVTAIAAQAAADLALGDLLRAGIDELAPWIRVASDDDALETKLRRIEESAFFRALRPLVAHHLYDDPQVRAHLGYPGASYQAGGYLHRGFDDLRWLPEPRIEESPEPLVELGPLPYPLAPAASPESREAR
jgi:hypothetical protein